MREHEEVSRLELLLWQIGQKINLHTRRFLAREGLTMARFIALSNLSVDQPMTMGKLQRKLYQTSATLTGLIDGLVEKEMVRRWRDDSDRRAVFLAPTEKGMDLLKRVFAFRASILDEALKGKTGLELSRLNSDMEEILRCLKAVAVEDKCL